MSLIKVFYELKGLKVLFGIILIWFFFEVYTEEWGEKLIFSPARKGDARKNIYRRF